IRMLGSCKFLLNSADADKVTEYDYVVQVWAPLIKALVNIHDILHMKTGSSPTFGIACKKRVYEDCNVGFKVDICVLFDSMRNEHDLLLVEVATTSDDTKFYHDLSNDSKLVRGAKDNLDTANRNIYDADMHALFLQVER
ncbi:hypothetical protein BC940DRAFT_238410, partial [Gongronella butleri]